MTNSNVICDHSLNENIVSIVFCFSVFGELSVCRMKTLRRMQTLGLFGLPRANLLKDSNSLLDLDVSN